MCAGAFAGDHKYKQAAVATPTAATPATSSTTTTATATATATAPTTATPSTQALHAPRGAGQEDPLQQQQQRQDQHQQEQQPRQDHNSFNRKNSYCSFALHYTSLERAAAPFKLTWLVLGEDPAARSHRVEQLTAL